MHFRDDPHDPVPPIYGVRGEEFQREPDMLNRKVGFWLLVTAVVTMAVFTTIGFIFAGGG